ncbi:iron-sulfur cluster biosynthesis family protein [Peribacillus sp. SCS-37]|uniref:iron-sulfur cluster biosynthesis family protein n=1 Tax=Paraperibacillus esterisolvens TaxID=3115296 RepID=UPI0039067310
MLVVWTEKAKSKIDEKIGDSEGSLKLKYDIDGCGCAVSGVTALWLENSAASDEQKLDTNAGPLYIESSKAIFLDDEMKIDYNDESNSFRLSSPNQIINPRMRFINYTKI